MVSSTPTTGRAGRYALIGVAAVLAVLFIGFLWMVVLAPHPTDFAGGSQVALAEYHAQDPTGVPAELKGASLIERGEYLTRAADCAACGIHRSAPWLPRDKRRDSTVDHVRCAARSVYPD